jgi:hypothetical protein
MTTHNPYAAPKARVSASATPIGGDSAWREDNQIVMLPGALLPQRCVKCNEPADEPTKTRKVYYHHPALYLLVFGWAIIYIIVALIVRKTAEINPGLCAEHKKQRALWMAISWFGALGSLFLLPMLAAALSIDFGPWMLLCIGLFLGFAITGIVKARILYPKKIDDHYARLKGAGENFLASLPQFRGY